MFVCPRSNYTRDDETVFLANLKPLWRGFLNMAAVAKMVTKMYPVSGVLDSLNEVTAAMFQTHTHTQDTSPYEMQSSTCTQCFATML